MEQEPGPTRGPLCWAVCWGPAKRLQTLKGEPTGQRGGREGRDTGTRCTYPRAPSPPPCRAPATGPGRRPAGCPPGGRCSGPCSALPTSSSAAAAARALRRQASLCGAARGPEVRVATQSTPPAQHPGSPRLPNPQGPCLQRPQALLAGGNRPGRRPGSQTLAIWLPRGSSQPTPTVPFVLGAGRGAGAGPLSGEQAAMKAPPPAPAPPRAPAPTGTCARCRPRRHTPRPRAAAGCPGPASRRRPPPGARQGARGGGSLVPAGRREQHSSSGQRLHSDGSTCLAESTQNRTETARPTRRGNAFSGSAVCCLLTVAARPRRAVTAPTPTTSGSS